MSNIIVMAFSPRNIVGCLLKKGLQRGGGGVTGTPKDPPRYALGNSESPRMTRFQDLYHLLFCIAEFEILANFSPSRSA